MKEKLIQRLQDKEAAIRTQAVYALSRLQGTEEPEENPEDPSLPSDPIVARFVELLQQDTSAYGFLVLLGLPFLPFLSPSTFPTFTVT